MERRTAVMLSVRGTLAIVFGILAMVWPGVTVFALAVLFGIFAVVTGVQQLAQAFARDTDPGPRAAGAVAGLFGLVAGVLALFWPGITVLVLAVMIGVWALATGIADLWVAAREHGGWWLALVGAVSIVAGLFVILSPAAGAVAIAWAIGLYAVVSGAIMLYGAWQLTHQGSGRGHPTPAGI